MFKPIATFMVAFVALLVMTTVAKADFVIDTFTSPNPAGTFSSNGSAGVSYFQRDEGINGALRFLSTGVYSGSRPNNAADGFLGESAAFGAGFRFVTSQPVANLSSAPTSASLSYLYASRQDFGASGSAVRLAFDNMTAPMSVTVTFRDDTFGTTFRTYAPTGTSSLTIPLSQFAGGNLNLGEVTGVYLLFNVNDSGLLPENLTTSITLRDIRVTSPSSGGDGDPPVDPVVPAPPVAVLLLAAVPALGLVRFGRRKLGL